MLGGYPDGSHSVRAWPLCEPLRLLSSPQSGAFDGRRLVSTALCACARALSNKYGVDALCWLCSRLVATSGTHVCRSVWDLRVEPKLQSIPTNLIYFSNAMYQKNDFRASFSAISLKTLVKKLVTFRAGRITDNTWGCALCVDLERTCREIGVQSLR